MSWYRPTMGVRKTLRGASRVVSLVARLACAGALLAAADVNTSALNAGDLLAVVTALLAVLDRLHGKWLVVLATAFVALAVAWQGDAVGPNDPRVALASIAFLLVGAASASESLFAHDLGQPRPRVRVVLIWTGGLVASLFALIACARLVLPFSVVPVTTPASDVAAPFEIISTEAKVSGEAGKLLLVGCLLPTVLLAAALLVSPLRRVVLGPTSELTCAASEIGIAACVWGCLAAAIAGGTGYSNLAG